MGTYGLANYSIFFAIVFSALLLGSVGSQQAYAGNGVVTHHVITNPNGGDCSKFGTWNPATSTCTLTRDLVNENITVPDAFGGPNDGITIDGAGHSITGPDFCEYIGVFLLGVDGVTVKNVLVQDWFTGILILDGNGNFILSNTAQFNCGDGILVDEGDFSEQTISGNTASNNGEDGIHVGIQNDNIISNNVANNNGDDGIEVHDSDGNTITGNTANANDDEGIQLNNADRNTVKGNTANSNGDDGIDLDSDSDFNKVENNTTNSNEGDGICTEDDSDDNEYTGNIANNNGDDGFDLDNDSFRAKFTNNQANNNGDNGFDIDDTEFSEFIDNTANGNGENGFQIEDSNNLTFTDNEANDNDSDGFQPEDSNDSVYRGNTVNNNGDDGIDFQRADDNEFTDNTVSGNGGTGFQVDHSEGNEFNGNTANDNGGSGFRLNNDPEVEGSGSNSNTFDDNTANGNGVSGFELRNSSDSNTFTGNIANGNTDEGFELKDSNDNTFIRNTANNNKISGFDLDRSDDNTFEENTANSNGKNGFDITDSGSSTSHNEFICNIASFNAGNGILLKGDSFENVFDGNTLESNGLYGMDIEGPSTPEDTEVHNNNFISNTLGAIRDSGISSDIDGNYYDNYDEFGEGCEDTNVDEVCDDPTSFASEPQEVVIGSEDGNARTKLFICEGKEPEPPTNVCLTTGGVQTSTFEPFSNIGVVVPGSEDLEIIGDPEVTPTKVYGLVRDSGGNLIASGDSEGGPFISQVDPNTGELLISPFIETFVDTGEGTTTSILITDLAVQPGTGVIYGITDSRSAFDFHRILWTVNPETGEVVGKGLLYPDVQGGLGGPGILYEPRGIGFGPDGKLFAILDLKNEAEQIMLEIEFDGDERTVMRTMDIDDEPDVDGFLVCPDGTFMYTGREGSSSIGFIDPVTGELIETSHTDEVLGDLAFRPTPTVTASSGNGGPYEVPTIGLNNKGMPVVKCGVMFDTTCFDITSKFHFEFELYEMMSGTHTISITTYCAQGVDKCNYVALAIMPYSEDMNNATWKIELHKDHLGNLTPVLYDPEGFIVNYTVTAQVVGDKFWLVSFTIEFANKDTDPMKFGIQVRDNKHGVQNTYLNEGVQFKDAHAYPYIETAFEAPLEVEPLCIGEDVFHRGNCAFDKVKEWATGNAEETMRQIMNNEYTYK